MPPRKKTVKSPRTQPASSTRDAAKQYHPAKQSPPLRAVRIPPLIRYTALVLVSLCLSSGLFTLTSEHTLDHLGGVSKAPDGRLVAWKGVELSIAWIMGLGVRDISYFIFLTHLPTFALLSWFYKIRTSAILGSYAIVILSSTTPFLLFRKEPIASKKQPTPAILQDRATTLYTTLAATAIFSLILYASYATWLPAQLVTHFANIPDISPAHAGPAGWPVLFLTLLPAGWAARDFLFGGWARAAAVEAADGAASKKRSREREYLLCALYRKTWGALTAGTRALVSRTVVLTTMTLLNTVVQVAGTVAGVDSVGAGVWGAVWAVGCLGVGAVFGWIGAADGEL